VAGMRPLWQPKGCLKFNPPREVTHANVRFWG
jgi:hypothetical protein